LKMTIVVHSGDFDKVMSALIVGNGVLAMGGEVTLYFTFWGLQRLVRKKLASGPLSKMHFFGLGKWIMIQRMKKNRVATPERLMEDFRALGGKVIACEMTMELMGLSKNRMEEKWIDRYGAVGMYVRETESSDRTLFI